MNFPTKYPKIPTKAAIFPTKHSNIPTKSVQPAKNAPVEKKILIEKEERILSNN
ncbi:hypothetical protein [Psychrobacillus sp. FJAT-51614]|uniref:hypothetical protein n=1 Tax=Psychrobacillus mangrovi TaxID=3117745 RepID=UPI003013231F